MYQASIRDEILTAYQNGVHPRTIYAKYSITAPTLYGWLRQDNIPTRKHLWFFKEESDVNRALGLIRRFQGDQSGISQATKDIFTKALAIQDNSTHE